MCLAINFTVLKLSFEGQGGWDGAACFCFDACNKCRRACFYFSCVLLKRGGGYYHASKWCNACTILLCPIEMHSSPAQSPGNGRQSNGCMLSAMMMLLLHHELCRTTSFFGRKRAMDNGLDTDLGWGFGGGFSSTTALGASGNRAAGTKLK